MLRNDVFQFFKLVVALAWFPAAYGLVGSSSAHQHNAQVAQSASSSSIESSSLGSFSAIPTPTQSSKTFITSRASEPLFSVTFTPALNATAGISRASQCWNDIMTWRNQSASWYNANILSRTWSIGPVVSSDTVPWSSSTTIYPESVSTYTLCDGTPRVDVRPITHHFSGNSTTFWTVTLPQTPTYTPQPCEPDPEMCRIWYYDSNIQKQDDHELVRQCGLPAHQGAPCLIGGGPVQLVYWPVTTVGGDLCGNNGSTLPDPSRTGDPPVVTTLGHTFTSGSVYVSFKTLYASYNGFWDRIGPTFSDFILPLPSSAVSTQCGGWASAHGPGTALNYADLNWPVPASAYSCQDRCSVTYTSSCEGCSGETVPPPPECKTIWSDVDPVLAVPTQARDLVPEWSTCSFWDLVIPNFWFDPPIALKEQPAVATPTMPSSPIETTAAPKSSAQDGLPKSTGTTKSPDPVETVSRDPTGDPATPSRTASTEPTPVPESPKQTQSEQESPDPDPTADPGPTSMSALTTIGGPSSPTPSKPNPKQSRVTIPFAPISSATTHHKDGTTVISAGSLTLTESAIGPSAVAVNGTTLSVGGPEVTISEHVVSQGSSGLVWLSPKASSSVSSSASTSDSLPPLVTDPGEEPSTTSGQTGTGSGISSATSSTAAAAVPTASGTSSSTRAGIWVVTAAAAMIMLSMM